MLDRRRARHEEKVVFERVDCFDPEGTQGQRFGTGVGPSSWRMRQNDPLLEREAQRHGDVGRETAAKQGNVEGIGAGKVVTTRHYGPGRDH